MPASTHTLADGESACVNALARMCKEVWGGCPGRVVVRERARAHPSSVVIGSLRHCRVGRRGHVVIVIEREREREHRRSRVVERARAHRCQAEAEGEGDHESTASSSLSLLERV